MKAIATVTGEILGNFKHGFCKNNSTYLFLTVKVERENSTEYFKVPFFGEQSDKLFDKLNEDDRLTGNKKSVIEVSGELYTRVRKHNDKTYYECEIRNAEIINFI